jgi:hypothetical protein
MVEIRCLEGPLPKDQVAITSADNISADATEANPYDELVPDQSYMPRAGERALVIAKNATFFPNLEALQAWARAEQAQGGAEEKDKDSAAAAPPGSPAYKLDKGTAVQVLRIHGSRAGKQSSDAAVEFVVLSGTYANQRFFGKPGTIGRLTARKAVERATAKGKSRTEKRQAPDGPAPDAGKRRASMLAQAKALEATNAAAARRIYMEIMKAAPDSGEAEEARERLEHMK